RDPKDVFNKDGLVDELKKALSERILNTELDEHLDDDSVEGKPNHRNGYSKKSVLTGTSKMTLSVPRDRAGTFDPKLIAKYQRRFRISTIITLAFGELSYFLENSPLARRTGGENGLPGVPAPSLKFGSFNYSFAGSWPSYQLVAGFFFFGFVLARFI